MTEPKWTQDQSIAYECACELIGHLMAIKSEQIEHELKTATPNQEKIEALRRGRSILHQERETLNITDDAAVRRVRAEYGPIVRVYEAANATDHDPAQP